MAATLVKMYRKGGWIHVEDYLLSIKFKNPGDWSLLRHWGLIVRHPDEPAIYKVTKSGERFVRGSITVKKHIFIFNQRFLGFSDVDTDLEDALGDSFSFTELMGH
jgi:hypothetical protein